MVKSPQQFENLLLANKHVIYFIIKSFPIDDFYHDDLFQDISLKAWKNFDKFRQESTFTTWICTIARFTTIEKMRRLQEQSSRLRQYFLYYETTDSHIDTPYIEYNLPPIESLTEVDKRTLELRIQGLPFKSISAITGEPINRLITRMHRIKQKLSKEINTN